MFRITESQKQQYHHLLIVCAAAILLVAFVGAAAASSADEDQYWNQWKKDCQIVGSGTADDPYQIATTFQFKAFASYLSEGAYSDHPSGSGAYTSRFSVTGEGRYFSLVNDITLGSLTSQDILSQNPSTEAYNHTYVTAGAADPYLSSGHATSTVHFKGNFEGNGHTIYNVSIASAYPGGIFDLFSDHVLEYAGLFAYLDGATVSNLTLNNVAMYGGEHIGGIAGYAKDSVIHNCSVLHGIVVTSPGCSSSKYVGGLLGESVNSTCTDCHVFSLSLYKSAYIPELRKVFETAMEIKKDTWDVFSYFKDAYEILSGGSPSGLLIDLAFEGVCWLYNAIVGCGDGDMYAGLIGCTGTNSGDEINIITNCSTTVSISASDYLGGIVGKVRGNTQISSCFSISTIKGGEYLGGIVGDVSNPNAVVSKCYWSGNVSASGGKAGGIAGRNSGRIEYCNTTGTVFSSYTEPYCGGLVGQTLSTSTVDTCHSSCDVSGQKYVGGLIGLMHGSVSNCSAAGPVNGEEGYAGGLIGQVSYGSSVQNSVSSSSVEGHTYVGGLIGICYGSVSDCSASGHVSGRGQYVGGLLGKYDAGNSDQSLYHCHATGDVHASNGYAGGLVGYADGLIDGCYATGSANGYALDYVGGLVGYAEQTINNSQASGNVYGTQYVGGLAGYAERTITNSQASGNVYGTQFVGGLIGDGSSEHEMILTGCQATGTVNGTAYVGGLAGRTDDHIRFSNASGTVTATGDFVGGLVGFADRTGYAKTIENCSAEGAVTGLNNVGGLLGYSHVNVVNCHANGTVSGNPGDSAGSYIGGLIGKSESAHSITIEKCYATGNVTDGIDYVGGLIGYADDRVSQSYASGDVAAGGTYAGGLIGYAKKTVRDCYATGTVSGTTDVGGLTGYNNQEIEYCYASGAVKGDTNVGGLTGTSDDDVIYSSALNPSVSGESQAGILIGKRSGGKAINCYSWNDTKKTGSGGVDGVTKYSSRYIWDIFPDGMWSHLDTAVWKENDGNPVFELPVLNSAGNDTTSDARHLIPAPLYTVEFDTQGHGSPVSSQEISAGSTVTRPTPDPVESKFRFTGWYMNPVCTAEWDFDNTTITGNTTIYAGWELLSDTCLVVFDVQGHGTAPDAQYVSKGSMAAEPTPAPTENGWRFTGWYTDAACTAAWDFTTAVSGNMVLFAGWTQKTYLVRFDVQGNGTAPDPQLVVPGGKVSKPDDPADEKNVFAGWYADPACTNAWDFTTVIAADTTIYANWTPKMMVSFDVQGYSTAPAPQYVVSGENATDPGELVELEDDDVRFDGWYADPECTESWDFSTKITADTTIYAKWVDLCHVYFNNRGHGNETATQTVNRGSPAVQPGNPVDANYTFSGWYTDSDYTTPWNFATMLITGPTQIVAKWTPKMHTVTFDTQGGTPEPWTETCPYGELITKPADPVKSGYTFDGWHAAANGTRQWNFATSVVTGDMTLYADWTQAEHSITVNAPDTCTVDVSKHSADAQDIITVTVCPDRGYICTGVTSAQVSFSTPKLDNNCWSASFSMPDTDVLLTVTISPRPLFSVTTTPAANGTIIAVPASAYEGEKIVLHVLPDDDHTVRNSSVNLRYNGTTTVLPLLWTPAALEGSFVMPASAVTVDAEFVRTEFSVNIDADGHGQIFADPLSGYVGEQVNITIVPDADYNVSSFIVNGLDTASEIVWSGHEGVYTCIADADITAKVTFAAEPRTSYAVMNVSDGNGRVLTGVTKAYAGDTIRVVFSGTPGYVADTAAYTDADGQQQDLTLIPVDGIYAAEFIMPANDTTVSGTFRLMPITVTFVLDGTGTVNPAAKSVYYGYAYGSLPTPAREFNFFRGWHDTSGGQVTESSIVTTPGDHALIANWSGPISITNTRINFGTEYAGYAERTIEDFVSNPFAETVRLSFPVSSAFRFWNASADLAGTSVDILQNAGYAFNVTAAAGLPEGSYSADIGVIGVVNGQDVLLGTIPVTMSVLSAAANGDALIAVPKLPTLYTFVGGMDPTGKLKVIGVEGAENLQLQPTGEENISTAIISCNDTSLQDTTTITVTNVYDVPELRDISGFVPLPNSIITAAYPEKDLANGGTYQVYLVLKEVSGNLPSLIGEFNESLASAVEAETAATALAMVSAVNDAGALSVMNELITDDGVSVSFRVAKSKVPDTSRLVGYHVDEHGSERVFCEVTGSEGEYYVVTLTGTGISTYVLALSPTSVAAYVPSSGRNTGYTVILPEETAVSTVTQTVSPTQAPVTPTAGPATQSATSKSPAPFIGILAGLGAASLVLARMRR